MGADPLPKARNLRNARENRRYPRALPLPESLQVRDDALPQLLAQVTAHDLSSSWRRPWRDCGGCWDHARLPRTGVALQRVQEQSQDGARLVGARNSARCGPSSARACSVAPALRRKWRGLPTAMVAPACASVRDALVAAFHNANLRVYANEDVVGWKWVARSRMCWPLPRACDADRNWVECTGGLITRGLAEMTRLGLALGAQAQTFMGLSGLGDWC